MSCRIKLLNIPSISDLLDISSYFRLMEFPLHKLCKPLARDFFFLELNEKKRFNLMEIVLCEIIFFKFN